MIAVRMRSKQERFRAPPSETSTLSLNTQLRARRVSEFRRNLESSLELGARLCLLSLLTKGQGEIVVGFRIKRLQAPRLGKFRLRRADVARLQSHQPKIVVSLRKIRIAAHQLLEDASGARGVVILAKNQTQLDARVGVLGIKTERFLQLPSGFVQSS